MPLYAGQTRTDRLHGDTAASTRTAMATCIAGIHDDDEATPSSSLSRWTAGIRADPVTLRAPEHLVAQLRASPAAGFSSRWNRRHPLIQANQPLRRFSRSGFDPGSS